MKAPIVNATNDESAAAIGEPSAAGSTPNSSRAWVSRASSGSDMTSSASRRASSGARPLRLKISTSSSVSPSGDSASARRSMSSSRSKSSRWAVIETYSPAPIENAPATRPARPARRTTEAAGCAPAKPKMSDTLVTSPSDMPNTAARGTAARDVAVLLFVRHSAYGRCHAA